MLGKAVCGKTLLSVVNFKVIELIGKCWERVTTTIIHLICIIQCINFSPALCFATSVCAPSAEFIYSNVCRCYNTSR